MIDIEKLKQKILDLAIRGKLVPQDPNDEPASVLIEKIRAEKTKLVKEGKIKASKEDSYIYKGSDNSYYEKIGSNDRNIDSDKLFDLPESWVWVRLNSLFNVGSSKRVHKSDWRNSGVPFYRARDIESLSSGHFNSDLFIDSSLYEECKRKYGVPKIDDILVSAVGTLGKTFVIKSTNPFYYKDGNIICLSNFSKTNPDYIALLFESTFIKNQIYGKSHGVTVDTYTIERANETLLPLPPLNEQTRIVKGWHKAKKQLFKLLDSSKKITLYVDAAKRKILDRFFGENSSYKSYYPNMVELGNVLVYEQPGPFIVASTEYDDSYMTPVLTAGKSFILGYTNEKDGIYHVKDKVIIFDDFTTTSRLIDFDFKVKSSAMKILHVTNEEEYNITYLFYLLQTIHFLSDTHKRYWISEYSPLMVKIHTIDEQIKIVKAIRHLFSILDSIIVR